MRMIRERYVPVPCTTSCIQAYIRNRGANNLPMFLGVGRERGVIVGNAEDRLKAAHWGDPRKEHCQAQGFAADAIVEGLKHFGLAPTDASSDDDKDIIMSTTDSAKL